MHRNTEEMFSKYTLWWIVIFFPFLLILYFLAKRGILRKFYFTSNKTSYSHQSNALISSEFIFFNYCITFFQAIRNILSQSMNQFIYYITLKTLAKMTKCQWLCDGSFRIWWGSSSFCPVECLHSVIEIHSYLI